MSDENEDEIEMYGEGSFTPPWVFGGVSGSRVETYGTSRFLCGSADYVFPEDWQSGDGHGRKVMHVVARYIDTMELPDDKARVRQARRTVAANLDVCERTIRYATGKRLYGADQSNYALQFRLDLREIERLWKEHVDDSPQRDQS